MYLGTHFLFFVSGFIALVYEVLWMKELSLLFGTTSSAAASTLAVFFLGLAVGGYVWGRRARRIQRPLRVYGLLEFGVVVSALGYFVLLDLYQEIYHAVFSLFEPFSSVKTLLKVFVAFVVLFPPAFFIGGTFPVLSQWTVRQPEKLGRVASTLYAVNTLGAALGAYVAGFYLPLWLGFSRSYKYVIGLNLGLALVAGLLGGKKVSPLVMGHEPRKGPSEAVEYQCLPARTLQGLAFLSGFVTLGLEVLWTRMFSQVLQNSVYTFSSILVTFLVCLSLGSGTARILSGRSSFGLRTLNLLLIFSALLVAWTPFGFMLSTENLSYFGKGKGWGEYVRAVFETSFFVLGLPCVALGTLFPILLKLSERNLTNVGSTVGGLVALNTMGAMVGSLAAGFILLPSFGLWAGIQTMSALYFVVALLLSCRVLGLHAWLRWLPVGGLLLLFTWLNSSRLPLVKIDPLGEKERLLEVFEGCHGTTAVVEKNGALQIKVNNYYTLGGTGAKQLEERQAHLPLLIHPHPKSVFFLGMGTGITAGAALTHPVEKLVVSELVPEAILAAQTYFKPYLNGLFDDPRVSIYVEDGRHLLQGTSETFDVIVADLFIPWKAGTGSLYTVEHFKVCRDRLNTFGLFAQWIPLYQTTQEELMIIGNTMLEVFPLVTVWRGDFSSNKPILALVGHRENLPLSPSVFRHNLKPTPHTQDKLWPGRVEQHTAPLLFYYCGNASKSGVFDGGYTINTDDRPLIEYQAPISHRKEKVDEVSWFVGKAYQALLTELNKQVPPPQDPFLSLGDATHHAYVGAGSQFHLAAFYKAEGKFWLSERELEFSRKTARSWLSPRPLDFLD